MGSSRGSWQDLGDQRPAPLLRWGNPGPAGEGQQGRGLAPSPGQQGQAGMGGRPGETQDGGQAEGGCSTDGASPQGLPCEAL